MADGFKAHLLWNVDHMNTNVCRHDGARGCWLSGTHRKPIARFLLVVITLIVAGCSDAPTDVLYTPCPNTVTDSQQDMNGNVTRIRSEATARYGSLVLPRRTSAGSAVNMAYMVHDNAVAGPKAVVVLIAGGQLTANIVPDGMGGVSSAGGNFLVRSAHLFKMSSQLRVITIDRPSDYIDDIPVGNTSGYAYDGYRTSPRHAVDLSWVINAENPENLPVFIAGTSRGAISAVAQNLLAAGIALSSPATSGMNGRPIQEASIYPEVRPSHVLRPVHVLWHLGDTCSVSLAVDSQDLVGAFPDASGVGLLGGFVDPMATTACDALTLHGFLGIESCAVEKSVEWVNDTIASLPAGRPLASPALGFSTRAGVPLDIDLTGLAVPGNGGVLTYSLAHQHSSLGGTLELNGNVVHYTPPAGVSGTTDAFVYVVSESGSGTSHHVVAVDIN